MSETPTVPIPGISVRTWGSGLVLEGTGGSGLSGSSPSSLLLTFPAGYSWEMGLDVAEQLRACTALESSAEGAG